MLKDKGYLLARPTKSLARAWQRSGVPDSPAVEQPRLASEYGGLPGTVEFPEIWNDWAGGFGHAYRHPKDENSYFGFLSNPNTYHWSENFDPRFSRQLVHAQALRSLTYTTGDATDPNMQIRASNFMDVPLPSTSSGADSAGAVLVMGRTYVTRWVPTGINTAGSEFDANIPLKGNVIREYGRKPAIHGSYVYFGETNPGTNFYRLNMGDLTFTNKTAPAYAYAVAGNDLWRAFGDNPQHGHYIDSVAVTDADSVWDFANWTATLSIGNGLNPVTDMISLDDQLYCGTPEGLYAGDKSGSFFNVLGDLRFQIHPDNCRDLSIHNHQVIAPHIGGLFAYTPSTTTARARNIGPQILSNRSPVHGRFRCARPLGNWLYGGYYNGSYSYILAGFDESGQQQGAYTWHTLQRLPAPVTKISRIHFDGISSSSGNTQIPNRMWIATDGSIDTGGTAPVYWSPIPLMNDNPLLPSERGFTPKYTNSARMDLGQTDGRTPTTPKIYRQVEVWSDNLDGVNRWALLYYTLNGGGTRNLLGTIITSPKSILYFPTGDGSFVIGQSIELSLESYIGAGQEATTPVYRSIILRQTQTPRSVDVITAIADLGDGMVDRQGAPMRPGFVQIQELRDMAGSQPVQLTDVLGNTSWVKIQQPVEEQEQWQEGMQAPSVLATIRLSVMNFSGP